ncbi:MAG: Hpt domain-containing protein [Bulleidia sp.]
MTVQELYEKIGGNYQEVLGRLPNDRLIIRFAGMFLQDESYDQLQKAMAGTQRESAFRAAHTLKGVCGNLSFTKLYDSCSELTEALRSGTDDISDSARQLFETVQADYRMTVEEIQTFLQ